MSSRDESEINAETVERRKNRLLDLYDPELETESTEIPNERYQEMLEVSQEGYIGGGYVFVEKDDEVLLIKEMDKADGEKWVIPGGGVEIDWNSEEDNTFEEAAKREVWEETNIECEITGLLLVYHYIFRPENPGEIDLTSSEYDIPPDIHILSVTFEGGYKDGEVKLIEERWDEEEILEAEWFASVPEDAHRMVEDFF